MENFGLSMFGLILGWLPLAICIITRTDNNFFLVPSLAWCGVWIFIVVYVFNRKSK